MGFFDILNTGRILECPSCHCPSCHEMREVHVQYSYGGVSYSIVQMGDRIIWEGDRDGIDIERLCGHPAKKVAVRSDRFCWCERCKKDVTDVERVVVFVENDIIRGSSRSTGTT